MSSPLRLARDSMFLFQGWWTSLEARGCIAREDEVAAGQHFFGKLGRGLVPSEQTCAASAAFSLARRPLV